MALKRLAIWGDAIEAGRAIRNYGYGIGVGIADDAVQRIGICLYDFFQGLGGGLFTPIRLRSRRCRGCGGRRVGGEIESHLRDVGEGAI